MDGDGRGSRAPRPDDSAPRLVSERSRLTNRINGALLRYGHTVGQLGPINGNLVRPLIEDFCTQSRVSLYPEYSPTTSYPLVLSL